MVGNTRRLYTRDSRAFCAAEIEDLSGVVEVTVWPELFERTHELWMEGNILLLQVRARERNGRLQIAVQQVELYQLADGTPAGFVPPLWAPAQEQGTRNKEQGQGATRENGSGPPVAEVPPELAAEHRRSTAPAPNGAPKPAPSTASRAAVRPAATTNRQPESVEGRVATATRSLRVELRETEDEDADRDRLTRLLDALREFPGDDEVRLSVRTLDGAAHTVSLGKLRVRTCDALTDRLEDVLGEVGEVHPA
jgi:hypothetical protein